MWCTVFHTHWIPCSLWAAYNIKAGPPTSQSHIYIYLSVTLMSSQLKKICQSVYFGFKKAFFGSLYSLEHNLCFTLLVLFLLRKCNGTDENVCEWVFPHLAGVDDPRPLCHFVTVCVCVCVCLSRNTALVLILLQLSFNQRFFFFLHGVSRS